MYKALIDTFSFVIPREFGVFVIPAQAGTTEYPEFQGVIETLVTMDVNSTTD